MNLLSVREVADQLDLSPSLVRRYCRQGRLGQRVGGRWVISAVDLVKFQSEPRPVGYPKGQPRKESAE